jgi:hypothetical protein
VHGEVPSPHALQNFEHGHVAEQLVETAAAD